MLPLRERENHDPKTNLHNVSLSLPATNLASFSPLLFQGDSPFGKLEAYIKLEQLGEGSYATVFKGYSK